MNMQATLQIPVLPSWAFKTRRWCFCLSCGTYHAHGPGVGRRVPVCPDRSGSVYWVTGYVLVDAGPPSEALLDDIEAALDGHVFNDGPAAAEFFAVAPDGAVISADGQAAFAQRTTAQRTKRRRAA